MITSLDEILAVRKVADEVRAEVGAPAVLVPSLAIASLTIGVNLLMLTAMVVRSVSLH